MAKTDRYEVEFTYPDKSKQTLLIDDNSSAETTSKDPETGEEIEFYFAIVTVASQEGDQKLAQMCHAITSAGLHYHTYSAKSGGEYRITRFGATTTRLLAFADMTDFRFGVDAAKTSDACKAVGLNLENPKVGHDHWYAPYTNLFVPYEGNKADLYRPLTAGDKIILFKRVVSADTSFDGGGKGCGFDIAQLESDDKDNEFCLAVFPIHSPKEKAALCDKWMALTAPWKLPLIDIKEYFGAEIAFYFAFLGHITTGLTFLAPLGLLVQILSWSFVGKDGGAMYGEGIFALVALLGFFVILDSWRCDQSKKAHLWETFGCRTSLPPRPGFEGVVQLNPTTGLLDIDFPAHLRRPRERASAASVLTMTAILTGTVISIFAYKASLTKSGASDGELLIPAILNSIQITVFGIVYSKVADIMTKYENHRTIAEHNSALFKKLTAFYFINYFASLFYIAFVKSSVEGECFESMSGSHYCGRELSVQVFIVFIVNDFGNRLAMSVIVPYLTRMTKKYLAKKDDAIDYAIMGPVEKQYVLLTRYDPSSSLVIDYIEMFVQWGYMVLFGAACPIVVFFAFLTNFMETRTDGYKLLFEHRRVVPNRVDGIGEPLEVFFKTLYLAVPVNAGLVVYTFGAASWAPQEAKMPIFLSIIAFLMLSLSSLDTIYPAVPEETEVQIERADIIYDRIICGNAPNDGLVLNVDASAVGKTMREVKMEAMASVTVPTMKIVPLSSKRTSSGRKTEKI